MPPTGRIRKPTANTAAAHNAPPTSCGGRAGQIQGVLSAARNIRGGCVEMGDAAEDLAQDTFLRLFRAARDYTEQGYLRAYLFRIATNLVRSEERRAQRLRLLPRQNPIGTIGGVVIIIVILVAVFAPGGLIGLVTKLRRLIRG